MSIVKSEDFVENRRREIAAALHCITKEDYIVFTGYTIGTEEANRRRGVAPPHVVVGTVILYPLDTLAEFIRERVRNLPSTTAKSLL